MIRGDLSPYMKALGGAYLATNSCQPSNLPSPGRTKKVTTSKPREKPTKCPDKTLLTRPIDFFFRILIRNVFLPHSATIYLSLHSGTDRIMDNVAMKQPQHFPRRYPPHNIRKSDPKPKKHGHGYRNPSFSVVYRVNINVPKVSKTEKISPIF